MIYAEVSLCFGTASSLVNILLDQWLFASGQFSLSICPFLPLPSGNPILEYGIFYIGLTLGTLTANLIQSAASANLQITYTPPRTEGHNA
jgi:hypothetical protein